MNVEVCPNIGRCQIETGARAIPSGPTLPASADEARNAWEKVIRSAAESGQFFVTLGFRSYLDTSRAIHAAEHFVTRVNRALFGKRFASRGNFLRGIVVMEIKRGSLQALNSPHFHFIPSAPVDAKVQLTLSALQHAVKAAANRLRYVTRKDTYPLGRNISGPGYVDVQAIWDAHGLANYLTKEIQLHGDPLDGRNIGFVDSLGIVGLSTSSRPWARI